MEGPNFERRWTPYVFVTVNRVTECTTLGTLHPSVTQSSIQTVELRAAVRPFADSRASDFRRNRPYFAAAAEGGGDAGAGTGAGGGAIGVGLTSIPLAFICWM